MWSKVLPAASSADAYAAPMQTPSAPTDAWEYKKLILDWAEVASWETTLNAFGIDGWELSAAAAPPAPVGILGFTSGIPPMIALLKRRRRDP